MCSRESVCDVCGFDRVQYDWAEKDGERMDLRKDGFCGSVKLGPTGKTATRAEEREVRADTGARCPGTGRSSLANRGASGEDHHEATVGRR